MFRKIKKGVKAFFKDQRGALTTLEIVGYTVLIGGAVALVGYGATTLARGKLGQDTAAITAVKAINKPITGASDYSSGATPTTDANTGILTTVVPTN